jgi:hypothetical protein
MTLIRNDFSQNALIVIKTLPVGKDSLVGKSWM